MSVFVVETYDDFEHEERILHYASSEEGALNYIRTLIAHGYSYSNDLPEEPPDRWHSCGECLENDSRDISLHLYSYPLDKMDFTYRCGYQRLDRRTINLSHLVG